MNQSHSTEKPVNMTTFVSLGYLTLTFGVNITHFWEMKLTMTLLGFKSCCVKKSDQKTQKLEKLTSLDCSYIIHIQKLTLTFGVNLRSLCIKHLWAKAVMPAENCVKICRISEAGVGRKFGESDTRRKSKKRLADYSKRTLTSGKPLCGNNSDADEICCLVT